MSIFTPGSASLFMLHVIVDVLLLLALQLMATASSSTMNECIHAGSRKYNGYYDYERGQADVVPFHSFKESSGYDCNFKCMENDTCLATSLDDKKTCSFYNTSNFNVAIDGILLYSIWRKCDMSKGEQNPDGRCKGRWVTVRSYGNLGYVRIDTAFSRSECKAKCLGNPLCGSINMNATHCILVPRWPWENTFLNKTGDPSVKMDTWTCVNDFIETFNITTKDTKPIEERCTGHWLMSARHANLTCSRELGMLFHTQVYSECHAECEQHPMCQRVYYNFTYSVCVLDCIERTDHKLHPPDMTFMEFEWVCTRNDSQKDPMNADEQRLMKLGMTCLKIASVKHLFIARDRCGSIPPGYTFSKCDEIFDNKEWKIKDSCRVNQTYWAFPTTKTNVNITGYGLMNVTRVFTGLELYWLAYVDADNVISADYLECRVFNASRAIHKLDAGEIVSREQWYHQPPIGEIYRFSQMPTKVVITASQQPLHSCRTKAAGVDLMRWIQVLVFGGAGTVRSFNDVSYNFFVDENGNIYEGRGWKQQSAAVAAFNKETIAIGFIGCLKYKLPSERFLNSVKKLIEYGVDHNYIDKDYRVYIHQDLGRSRIHKNLLFVIRNWYRYKVFLPTNCSNLSKYSIYLNAIAVIICLSLFSIFYKLCFFASFCKNCRFLSKGLTFEKIFPCSTSFSDLDEMFSTSYSSNRVRILHERFPETRVRLDYFQLVSIVKAWVCSTFLGTFSSHYNGDDLKSILRNYSFRSSCEIYEARLTSTSGSSLEKLIACVSSTGSTLFLRNLIESGSCVCTYYKTEHIHRNELVNDRDNCVMIDSSYKFRNLPLRFTFRSAVHKLLSHRFHLLNIKSHCVPKRQKIYLNRKLILFKIPQRTTFE